MKKHINVILLILIAMFGFTGSVYAVCPLGPDVTRDLHGVLKIINYAAPLLLIVFSIIDVLKAITKGDAQGNVKAVRDKFLKRLLYTAILFFIPILVDQFMIMADVWDSEGGCDLFTPVDNGQDGTPGYGDGTHGSGGSGGSATTTVASGDGCNTRGLSTCASGDNCVVHNGKCVKACGALAAAACPSDRCYVGNGGLCYDKVTTPTSTTTTVKKTYDQCNALSLASCASASACEVHYGSCVKACGAYAPGACPTDRCQVKNNACYRK